MIPTSLAAETRSVASAGAALKLTRLGYGVGNASVVQVLDAQRQSEQAELGACRRPPSAMPTASGCSSPWAAAICRHSA